MGGYIYLPSGAGRTGPWGLSGSYVFSFSQPVLSASHFPFGSIDSVKNYLRTPIYTLLYFYHDFDLYESTTFTPTITASLSTTTLASVSLGWSPAKDAGYIASSTTAPTGVSFSSPSITGKVFNELNNYWGVWLRLTPSDAGYGKFTTSVSVAASLTIAT